jgi:hypothetical protein
LADAYVKANPRAKVAGGTIVGGAGGAIVGGTGGAVTGNIGRDAAVGGVAGAKTSRVRNIFISEMVKAALSQLISDTQNQNRNCLCQYHKY